MVGISIGKYIATVISFDISDGQCAGEFSRTVNPRFAHLTSSAAAGPPIPIPSLPMSFRPEAIRGANSSGGVVDYRLTREAVVREYRKGRLAPRRLRRSPRAATGGRRRGRFHQRAVPHLRGRGRRARDLRLRAPPCPRAGAATTARELARLTRGSVPVSCYVVEVCPACAWNHLTRVFQVGGS